MSNKHPRLITSKPKPNTILNLSGRLEIYVLSTHVIPVTLLCYASLCTLDALARTTS